MEKSQVQVVCSSWFFKYLISKVMVTEEKTSLWLNLRKEYIDENFGKLKSWLSECS